MTTEFLGYPVPVAYSAGLEVSSTWFTVTYDGSTYVAVADAVPFTTAADFDASKWDLIEGVTADGLAATNGASLVGYRESTISDVLSNRAGKVGYLSDYAPDLDLTQNTIDIVPYVQAAILDGICTLIIGEGHFKWATDLADPLQVNLIGQNHSEYMKPIVASSSASSGGAISLATAGTWLHLSNPTAENASVPIYDSALVGIAFFDDRQDFVNWTTTSGTDPDGVDINEPTAFGPAVRLTGTSARFDNLMFLNCYDALHIGASGIRPQHIHGGKVHISLINVGVKIWGLGGGGAIDRIHIYPTWSQLWDYADESYRVNRYADGLGVAYQAGDASDPQTFEQVVIKELMVIGAADGAIIGGKGHRIIAARIDNCMRPFTFNNTDNSAYHVLSNVWATSFYGYTEATRNDGTFYLVKLNGAGGVQIDNLVSPRSDGYGIWAWGQSTNCQISNVQLYNQGYMGVVMGRSGTTSGTANLNNVYVYCRSADTIPYSWYDWTSLEISGLHYSGTTPTTISQYLGANGQLYSGRNKFDLSTLGVQSLETNRAGWQRFGGTSGVDELVISSSTASSTSISAARKTTLRNSGATNSGIAIGVSNADTSGTGYGRMDLMASVAGVLTSAVYIDPIVNTLAPTTDNKIALGVTANRYTQLSAVNSTVNTSDARLKSDPRAITDAEVTAFRAIRRMSGVWQWLAKIAGEGDSARLHSGPTVQAAIAVMSANGLDWTRYGAFCHDTWDAVAEQTITWEDEYDAAGLLVRSAGSETIPAKAAGDVYSFRKEELLLWIAAADGSALDSLEARISALEGSSSS